MHLSRVRSAINSLHHDGDDNHERDGGEEGAVKGSIEHKDEIPQDARLPIFRLPYELWLSFNALDLLMTTPLVAVDLSRRMNVLMKAIVYLLAQPTVLCDKVGQQA